MSTSSKAHRPGSDSGRRILEILFAFTEERPRRTARELSEALDVPTPSVHRYVALLRSLGLITGTRKGLYQLTPRVMLLSRAAQAANSLLEVAGPHLSKLALELNETVILVELIAGNPVCVARQESNRALRPSFQPGQAMPGLRGASAKVLISGMTPEERRAHIARVQQRSGESAPGDAWEADIEAARVNGWATSAHEVNEGVWAAAAAIEHHDKIIAAVSIASAEFRLTDDMRETILERTRETARAIAADLHRQPDIT